MKKNLVLKLLTIIISIIVLLILLIPRPLYADDGGTEVYKAKLYSVEIRHSIWENNAGFDWYRADLEEGTFGYLTGTKIKIFGRIIRDNTEFLTSEECECKRCNRP